MRISPRDTRRKGREVYSFAPVAAADAQLLILGSMPGRESLRRGQYYAHPHNAFWRMLGALVGAGPELPYAKRLARLKQSGIALWDVLQSCSRESSLDSDIVEASIVPNDFAAFYARHPQIRAVYFNGAKAEAAYRRYVLSGLSASFSGLIYRRLPSTSPANASTAFERKLHAWRQLTSDLPLY